MLEPFDYKEPCCPFDTSFYKDAPGGEKPRGHISVPDMIASLDRLYARNDQAGVERVLEEYASQAKALGDVRGELSVVNEMLGHYRMSRNREKGTAAIERCLELLAVADIAGSVSAGTILLNAATAMRSFGKGAESIRLYTEASRCYAAHLPPEDTRFAGLYNNMASAYGDIGEFDHAELYYKRALALLSAHDDQPVCVLDAAVTCLNLAQFYNDRNPEDERVGEYAEKAMALFDRPSLPRDYYYAHTAGKCAGGFSYLGYFLYASTLSGRAKAFYRERS
ncbi:MAG: tetratricopeptide repeat protein [Eubacteriales bacterium]